MNDQYFCKKCGQPSGKFGYCIICRDEILKLAAHATVTPIIHLSRMRLADLERKAQDGKASR